MTQTRRYSVASASLVKDTAAMRDCFFFDLSDSSAASFVALSGDRT